MEVSNELHQYQWIVNEGLLRDEGTLYGIAGAGMEEKVAAIRDHYRIKRAVSQTKEQFLNKKIESFNKHFSETSTDTNSLTGVDNPSNLFPIALQLLFYTSICYFNYWFESYWLSPFLQSTFICLGIYLFGLFSVFIGRSIMYNTVQSLSEEKTPINQREKWKIYFEELGVPLIVSLFISILPAKSYPIEFSIMAALFFFMLFLFGGKGLINTLFRARKELRLYSQYLRKNKDHKARTNELYTLQRDLESTIVTLEELNGEEEYKISIFASEYQLAFESRQLANGVSIKKFA
jgi:hypothetical protein